jgi:hypothetical protein
LDLANILHGFADLINTVDLSNILARIVDLAYNLVRILDCDFIVELLADSNLDKTIVGSRILLQIWADGRICIPLFTPPPYQRKLVINKDNVIKNQTKEIYVAFRAKILSVK